MGAHPLAQGISASVGEVSAAESKISGIRVFSIVSGQNQNPYMIIQIDVLTTIPCAMLVSDLHVFSTVRVVVVVVYLLYAGGRVIPQGGWGLLWRGDPACRARVAVRLCRASGWPMGDGFVVFRARGIWRDSPRAVGLRWLALAVSVRQRRQGGYRRITVASAIRAIEAEAEQHNHVVSVMPGVDVCAGISNGLWPRGASLPMVHCQRRITRGSPRRAGLRRCRFYGRIPPTQAMPVFQAGRPPATGSFGCAPDYPVELDWRGSLADCWFQQWSGVVLSWVSH